MLRILLTVIAAALVTVFAVDNMHRVEVGLVVGRPAHVRLFFLLLTSFLIGSFVAMFIGLYLRTATGRKKNAAQDTDDEEFFTE